MSRQEKRGGKIEREKSTARDVLGFPGSSVVKNLLQCRRQGFDPWVRKSPLEGGMAAQSSILA